MSRQLRTHHSSPITHHSLARRAVWRIGDWGGASGQIGRRWEAVGDAALERLVGCASPNRPEFVPRAVVSFVREAELEQAVQAVGLSHADALLLGVLEGRLALQPVDFKWSLEVARADQVAAETLQALLEADLPPIREALEARLERDTPGLEPDDGRLPPVEQLTLLDGRFLAPEHAANRAFLHGRHNRRRERPIDPRQVVFQLVDGPEFFSPLPGWEVGLALAAREGTQRVLESLDGAEHFYRLGAGVLGALTARKRSIFEPSVPKIDALAELAALRRAQRLMTTDQLIAYLQRAMVARAELVRTLNQLGRTIYPFSAFRAALRTAGIVLRERSEGDPEQRRWSRLYGLVQRELSARLAVAGRELVAGGRGDAQALAALSARGAAFAQQAAASAARLIAEEAARSEAETER
jgi:hypothetical protein